MREIVHPKTIDQYKTTLAELAEELREAILTADNTANEVRTDIRHSQVLLTQLEADSTKLKSLHDQVNNLVAAL